MPTSARRWLGLGCLLAAAAIWVPAVHVAFPVDVRPIFDRPEPAPIARAMAARQLRLWNDPAAREAEIARMRRSNAEWDFMGRTFLVLALANVALRDPGAKTPVLEAVDRIIEETLRLEEDHGFWHFSMGYARSRPYVDQPARSQFVDGEIALMLAARRLVEEKPAWKPLLADRVRLMEERMRRGPVLSAESYPDECWTFDNANALAAMRMTDALDGTDHRELCRDWVSTARRRLVEPSTGLLIAEFTSAGAPLDGPEGSTLWMAAHALELIDPAFARDQYDRSRAALRRRICGFDVAREWPSGLGGQVDIDSGTVIPFVEASPASSGLALVAARSFGDRDFYEGLLRSLELAGFPDRDRGELRYRAANGVAEAVLFYSTVAGPLWAEVRRRNGS